MLIKFFKNSRLVKNFCLMSCSKKTSYFGNFAFGREYIKKLFFIQKKVIYSPDRIFALPSSKKSKVIIKTKNEIKKIQIKKDDCIDNFFKLVFNRLKKKNTKFFIIWF